MSVMENKTDMSIMESFRWWENKRIWFNLAVGFTGAYVLDTYCIRLFPGDIIGIILWGIVANLLFSLGFFAEMADRYYLKHYMDLRQVRWILFLAGTAAYVCVTYAFREGLFFQAYPPFDKMKLQIRTSGLLLAIMVALFGWVNGQWQAEVVHKTSENYLCPKSAPFHYVLGDSVALRESPGVKGRLLARLPIGTPVRLLRKSDTTDVLRGFSSHWYEVEGELGRGWIWGGLIAQEVAGSQDNAAVKFLGGYHHAEGPEPHAGDRQYYYQIRAVRQGRELDKIVLRSFSYDIGGFSNNGSMALKGVSDILLLNVPCMACEPYENYYVIFWDGRKFYNVLTQKGVELNAASTGLEVIFPADMDGEPNRVLTRYTSFERDPKTREVLEWCRVTEKFRWEGSMLEKTGGDKICSDSCR